MNFLPFPLRRGAPSTRRSANRRKGTAAELSPWAALVERLESRVLLASNITAAVTKGTLAITGSAEADLVTIQPGAQPGTIVVTVQDGTVNGQSSAEFTGVTKDLRVSLLGGNDQLVILPAGSTGDVVIPKNLTIDSGEGNDDVRLQHVRINGSTAITLGTGDDALHIDDSQFAKKFSVDGGSGNDGVLIERDTVFGGTTQFGKSTFSMGSGNDQVRVGINSDNRRHANFSKPLAVDGSEGSDSLVLASQSASKTKLKNIEEQPPAVVATVTAHLANDTGSSNSDRITSDPSIAGTVTGFTSFHKLSGTFSDESPAADLTSFIQSDGTFLLTETTLDTLFPGVLTDGEHTLHLFISDTFEVSPPFTLTFTLDTGALAAPTLALSLGSDTGTVGDSETSAGVVTLVGQTVPGALVELLETGATTTANIGGEFQFPNVDLSAGQNTFTVEVTQGGHTAQQTIQISRTSVVATSDIILDANTLTLNAIRRDGSDPLVASRLLAMVSLAGYDVVSAFEGTAGFAISMTAPAGASLSAAVAAATVQILSHEFPTQTSVFNDFLNSKLADVPDGPGEASGVQFGTEVGQAILAQRDDDGSRQFVGYVTGEEPGMWIPTAPGFMPAMGAHWPQVTPFVITDPDDYLPSGPTDLSSAQWATDFNQVKDLGAADSTTRTADQTQIARFWSDGQGTYTPPGHWNEIAQKVALLEGNSVSANARMLAMLNLAMMDAGIVAFDAKYEYDFWRPITAIQAADTDGNAATALDPDWQPLLGTPAFPEYVSGHSTFSGAAAGVLISLFGDSTPFTSTSIGLPNVTRNYTSFTQAAEEAGLSRIYGGIHFLTSDLDGLAAGHEVAAAVIDAFAGIDTQPPRIIIDEHPGAASQNVTLTGRVLDSVSGVATLTVKIDGGTPLNVTFNPDTGEFTFPLNFTTDGTHHIVFTAVDAVGNVSTPADEVFILDSASPTITINSPAPNAEIVAGMQVTGHVDGTGSEIRAMSYTIDGGVSRPVSFDVETGNFIQELDVGPLALGPHVLHLTATDAAGQTVSTALNLTLTSPLPLTITGSEPKPNASEVSTAFHPRFFFSRPVDPATLTTANFSATVSGQPLAISIVPDSDGTAAWVFFQDPMPGSATIQITVNGSGIHAADGTLLDADGDGTAGGTLTTTFRTISSTPVSGTSIVGYVLDPGPDSIPHDFDDVRAGPDGIINTPDDVRLLPLAGVKVFVHGREDQAVFTDATGKFVIDPAPVGNVKLVVQGGTAANAPAGFYFPEMVMDMESLAGEENWAMEGMPEFYLPRIPLQALHDISTTEPTTFGLDNAAGLNLTPEQVAQVSMTVYPNTAIGYDGQPLVNYQAGISIVPADYIRMMLPNGVVDLPFSFTIQAPGVAVFTTPVSLTIPNLVRARPGTQLPLLSFDHATGLMAIEGTMTVSADGATITTDPGSGITHPGWHGPIEPPPPPPGFDGGPFDGDGPSMASADSIPVSQPGNPQYVVMTVPTTSGNPFTVRFRTDDGGHFESAFPSNQDYQIIIYDPGSGLVATGSGTSARPGIKFDPTVGLSLHPSNAPDSDGDGLPDDAEFAVGTDIDRTDSDNDGINDLAEVRQNLNPLSNRPVTVGAVGGVALRGEAKDLTVAGDSQSPARLTAFVATGSYGLAIVDVSEFTRPIILSELDLPGDATSVDADMIAQIAVVATNAGGLHFVNIADPLHPQVIRTISINSSLVRIADGVVYAAVGGQLRSYDEYTGEALQTLNLTGGVVTGLAREGTMLYTMDTNRVLALIDISGTTMVSGQGITLPHGGGKLFVSGGIAYTVAANVNGFFRGGFATVDVSNPSSPTLISGSDIVTPLVAADSAIAVNGSGLAVLVGTPSGTTLHGVEVYDLSDLGSTANIVRRIVLDAEPVGVVIAGGVAFVADGTGGLQIVNYRAFDNQGQPPEVFISSSAVDTDPGTPGDQIVEGSSIPISLNLADDVQVRDVELLVNGVVQATDVQAPFDFFALAPAIAPGVTQVTIQIRATDTGGNSALSNILTLGLTPDTAAPVVRTSSPADGSTVFDLNVLSVSFDEALDASLIQLSGASLINLGEDGLLGTGDDASVPLASIQVATPSRLVIVPDTPLPRGKFQFVLNKSMLSDIAGNHATSDTTITFTNYINVSPDTVVWLSDTDGAWEDAGNWSTGFVPGAGDDVLIDRIGANPTITHATGDHSVRSLITLEPFAITGGFLRITGGSTSQLQSSVTIASGGSLVATGAGTIVNVTGPVTLNSGSLRATNSGELNVPGLTSSLAATVNSFIQAESAGQINLPSLTTLHGAINGSLTFVRSFSGGSVQAPALTSIPDGAVQILSTGANSVVNLPQLTTFTDSASGASSFEAEAGGMVNAPLLTNLQFLDLRLDGPASVLNIAEITNIDTLNVFVDHSASLTLPGVTTLQGQVFNTFLQSNNGGALNLPNLTTLHGATGGSLVFIRAFSGGAVNAAALAGIPDGSVQVFSTGSDSQIDLSQMTSFITTASGASAIEAESGGRVKMPLLTNLQRLSLILDGATSVMDTNQITDIDTLSVFADHDGVLNLPGVTTLQGSTFNTFVQSNNGGVLNLPNLTTLHGGTSGAIVFLRAFSGGAVNATALATIPDGAVQILSTGDGSLVDLSQLTTFTHSGNGSSAIEAEAGGTVKIPLLTNLHFLSLTVDGAASAMDTAQLTDIDTISVFADHGAALNLPGVTTLHGNSFNTFLQSNNGAVLNLPNLTTLHGGTAGAIVFMRAFSGGDLNVTALATIPDGAVQILSTGDGSLVDLSQLTTFIHSGNGSSAIEAEAGGTVRIPLLTNLEVLSLTVDGANSAMDTAQLTDIDTISVFADHGAVLNLPGVTTLYGNTFNTFLQTNNGATLNLPNLTTLQGATAGAILFVRSFSGGAINASSLTDIVNGSVQTLATGTDSTINLPQLATAANNQGNTRSTFQADNGGILHLNTGTTTLTNVDLTVDASSTFTVGTLDLQTGARLFGNGTINGNVTNGGLIAPGLSTGAGTSFLTITGNYVQTAAGNLSIQIGGGVPGTQTDVLFVEGTATIAGTLTLALTNNFNPPVASTFQILVSNISLAGTFTTLVGTALPGNKTFAVSYDSDRVTLTVTSP